MTYTLTARNELIVEYEATTDKATPIAQQPVEPPAGPPVSPPGGQPARPREIGGPKGPEPTRYGDWEVNGRCTDF